MNPKMMISEAANYLGRTQSWIYARLLELDLPILNVDTHLYFNHKAAKRFFEFQFTPKILTFQILKGGTGKTSLAMECAVRASLYGAKVLCVDLDSQGNLTQGFGQNAEAVPVMIDHLAEGYPIFDSLMTVNEGIDILPSRIENALLDEVIRDKKLPLDHVYKDPLTTLKSFYDLIIVDCPPSLGQSVASAALAADQLIAPLIPEKFALSGFEILLKTIDELEQNYQVKIPVNSVLNKYVPKNSLSEEALRFLKTQYPQQGKLLPTQVRFSEAFSQAASEQRSLFDDIAYNEAKKDVDALTLLLLGLSETIPFTESQKIAQPAMLEF